MVKYINAPQTYRSRLEWTATSPLEGEFFCHSQSTHLENMWIWNALRLAWNPMAYDPVVDATAYSPWVVMRRVSPETRACRWDECPLYSQRLSSRGDRFDQLPAVDICYPLKSHYAKGRYTSRRDMITKSYWSWTCSSLSWPAGYQEINLQKVSQAQSFFSSNCSNHTRNITEAFLGKKHKR